MPYVACFCLPVPLCLAFRQVFGWNASRFRLSVACFFGCGELSREGHCFIEAVFAMSESLLSLGGSTIIWIGGDCSLSYDQLPCFAQGQKFVPAIVNVRTRRDIRLRLTADGVSPREP
jgi:hypothetical protein